MNRALPYIIGGLLFILPMVLVIAWVNGAASRLKEAEVTTQAEPQKIAVAAQANATYCTPELKKILRRVLQSCGLIHGRSGRGCKPIDAKNVATMSGDDFNALLIPMRKRGGIVQYDQSSAELDTADQKLIDKIYAERRGASYFFVVARASLDGPVSVNRELSRKRAEAVLAHLKKTFDDEELEQQVGLLWLGEEYAQLDASFCRWTRSGMSESCTPKDLNRSAFVTWIDCNL